MLAARLGSGINQNRSLLAELIGKDVTSEMPGPNWKWWSISCRSTHRQLQNRLTTGMPTLSVVNLVVLVVGLQLTDLILYFRAQ